MKKYPIAERFTSLQGEGLYTGTLMHFVRFAGCSVGKKLPKEFYDGSPREIKDSMAEGGVRFERSELPVYTERCCTYDGREFLCDTDFRTKEVLTMKEILDGIPSGVDHLCFTGGEPLNQPLSDFFNFIAENSDYKVHVETSGTVSLTKMWPEYNQSDSVHNDGGWLWITVSPKRGVLSEMIGLANEVKLLVDDEFSVERIPEEIKDHEMVWIQPINFEFDVDRKNLDRCIQLIKEYPDWRLSTQMHKIWKVR